MTLPADGNLILIVLAVLTLATALNLFLTLRLAAKFRAAFDPGPRTLPAGQPVPAFAGQRRLDGKRITSTDLAGQAAILAFVSPGCSACREKVAELADILPDVLSAGIALWIVPADAVHDVARLVGDTPLVEHVLVLDKATRRRLNPDNAVPFYIFIEDPLIVRASGTIGDDDWLSFVGQMRELAAGKPVAGSNSQRGPTTRRRRADSRVPRA